LEIRTLQDSLAVPWVQYGLAPFLAGLVVAELCNRLRISGLALIAGIVTTAALSARGLPPLVPIAAPDRIVFAAAFAAIAGLVLDLAPKLRRPVAAAAALCAGAAVIWIVWPKVNPSNWLNMLPNTGLGVMYAVWTAGTLTLLADTPERAGAAGVGAGGAIGVCALIAGAPQLAAIAFAVASASGAYVLIQIISNARLSCGLLFALPLAAACALIPPAAVLSAGLSWYLMPALALVPAAALIPISERLAPGARAVLAFAVALAAGAGVAAIAWYAIGAPVNTI
jgi:hypothetical protein